MNTFSLYKVLHGSKVLSLNSKGFSKRNIIKVTQTEKLKQQKEDMHKELLKFTLNNKE